MLKKKSYILMYILMYICVFFFIFGWKLSKYVDIIVIVSFVFTLYTFFYIKNILCFKHVRFLFILFVLIILYLSFIYFYHNKIEMHFILRTIRSGINFSAAIGIIFIFYKLFKNNWDKILIQFILYAIVLHSLIIIAMFINEETRSAIYELTNAKQYVNWAGTEISTGARITGLTYGLAQTSAIHLIGLPLIFLDGQVANKFLKTIFSIIILISIALTSKTGLILSHIVFLFIFYQLSGNIISTVKYTLLIMIGSIFLIISVLLLGSFDFINSSILFSHFMGSALNFQMMISDPQNFYYFKHIREMWIFPTDLETFMLGSGSLGREEGGYIATDLGYNRLIFGIGLLGLILLLLPFLYGYYIAFQIKHADTTLYIALLCCLTLSLIINFKEIALMTRGMWSIECLLICLCIIKNKGAENEVL
ncbi:hypothetical protein [Terasakiella sp. SH-1]|uniref:hypothetical protein n=1 Tax=Terasakiella sp. SH-1 TaxID=2560057 RepID=UPI0010731957|nr:hypothetical protein [Terasakiella sp. SH-1]